jgi:hypothetical protein
MVRAIFDFCPSVSEELPLFVGDVIEVLAVVDEFWLLGKKEDVTGERAVMDDGPFHQTAHSHANLVLNLRTVCALDWSV